jgi:hypothetical protein
MSLTLRKPILVGGVSLSLALWLWDSLQHSLIEAGEWTLLGTIAVGTGFWLLKPNKSKQEISQTKSLELTEEEVKIAIATAQHLVNCLETEASERDISYLKKQSEILPALLQKSELELAITGSKKAGKTTLQQILEKEEFSSQFTLRETEALLTETTTELAAKETALAADLVLFLVTGDLTDGEWQIIQELKAQHQHILLILNKQDQYTPEERIYLQQQLQHRVAEIIAPEDIVTITTAPNPIKVRKQQQDGSINEWMEEQPVAIEKLKERMAIALTQGKEQLLWGTTWRAANQLQQQAQSNLNQVRRERALPVIERYQWIAAAAAFANPVAALDLLATAAVNTQMLIDLSGIYQQKFSLAQAQTATGTIGKLMVQLGLVELSTQAIASILKSNAFTYVAGGAVQGVSAAYLTRIVGLSLIEYFQEQEINPTQAKEFNLAKLTAKLKQVFQENQRTTFLSNFVATVINRMSRESSLSANTVA